VTRHKWAQLFEAREDGATKPVDDWKCSVCGCHRVPLDVQVSPHGTSNWVVYRYAMPGREWVTKAPECADVRRIIATKDT
jgi:hypothetical protein